MGDPEGLCYYNVTKITRWVIQRGYYQVLNKRTVSFINFTTVFPQCPCLLRTYRLLIFGLRTSTARRLNWVFNILFLMRQYKLRSQHTYLVLSLATKFFNSFQRSTRYLLLALKSSNYTCLRIHNDLVYATVKADAYHLQRNHHRFI